jgi:hypothetical protein
MNAKKTLLIFAVIALFLIPWNSLLAAPVPPLRVVNHQTKECGEIFGGDECMDCFPPEGWESLGFSSEVPCPAGYTVVDNVEYTCQGFKVQFCCSEGHSGAPGNCQDLVVNDRKKQCAFVDDIQTCALPEPWTKKPDSVTAREWACPAAYTWLDALQCAGQEGGETGVTPQSGGEQAEGTGLPCLGTALAGPAVVGLWLLLKGRR